MKPNNSKLRSRATFERLGKRSGFTLIELLTVIAIIGMLSAISITTVRSAIQSAKETQTRTTIAKIDNVLTAAYEKYQYRRFDDSELKGAARTPVQLALNRVLWIRDLLRSDFPCTVNELKANSIFGETSLQNAYRSAVGSYDNLGITGYSTDESGDRVPVYGENSSDLANAQLLYLVVMNVEPEARASFTEREIANIDGGLNYFVDGWGNPICWARWAPGLTTSDRQPTVDEVRDRPEEIDVTTGTTGFKRFDGDYAKDSDPFNPLNVFKREAPNTGNNVSCGWFLVPYVYSSGSDGVADLVTPAQSESANGVTSMNDPFGMIENQADDAVIVIVGAPNGKNYKDNIDNHTLVR